MPTNVYFNHAVQSEQDLHEDLVVESLRFYGHECFYLPRTIIGQVPIRFNKAQNRLYLDMDWSNAVTSGEYIIIDCYRKIDPTQFTDVYNDVWLKKYVTALIKKQWGQNLSKFEGVQLPGGVTLQGRQILEDANTEIEKLEEQSNLLQTESAIMMG